MVGLVATACGRNSKLPEFIIFTSTPSPTDVPPTSTPSPTSTIIPTNIPPTFTPTAMPTEVPTDIPVDLPVEVEKSMMTLEQYFAENEAKWVEMGYPPDNGEYACYLDSEWTYNYRKRDESWGNSYSCGRWVYSSGYA